MITCQTKICAVVGHPVFGSLSPVIHNAGLKSLGLSNKFAMIGLNVAPEKLENFVSFLRQSNIRGLSVTLPHKESIMPMLDQIDPIAKEIGAVNTIINQDGKLVGYNADWAGATTPLKKLTSLSGKKVAVIGAGGAAKAFVYGLKNEGAEVMIFNRSIEKAEALAKKFDCDNLALDQIAKIKDFDIICNASSVGFSGADQADISPVPSEFLRPEQIIFDAIYSPLKTKLLYDAKAAGATTIPGTEMLLHQGFVQFEKFFGQPAPENVMRQKLLEYLDEN